MLGRYPDLSLKEARALARQDRALLQQGKDVAAAKQLDKLKASDIHTVENLSEAWYARHILGSYKHPEVVERVPASPDPSNLHWGHQNLPPQSTARRQRGDYDQI